MIILSAIATYFIITAIITVSICVLSARMRQHEEWEESPLIENHMELNLSSDYQTDVAAS